MRWNILIFTHVLRLIRGTRRWAASDSNRKRCGDDGLPYFAHEGLPLSSVVVKARISG
jgi:hypothetical protein